MGERAVSERAAGDDSVVEQPQAVGNGERVGAEPPTPQSAAETLKRSPGEQRAILSRLHRTMGNAFVQEVLRVMNLAAPEGTESLDQIRLDADVPTITAAPDKAPNAEVADLLQWKPTGADGPKGTGAWILRAGELGFIETNQATNALEDLKGSRPVHTRSASGDENAARQKHPGWYRHITKNPRGGHDFDLTKAPVLDTIVAIASKRIQAWLDAGGTAPKPKVLRLGDFVRPDFAYPEMDSKHRKGEAIDLYPQGTAITPQDAIDILRDLPSGKLTVFLDNPNALHIDQRAPGEYGLGIPANYISPEYLMGPAPEYRNGRVERAEREAGNDHGRTLRATAISTDNGHFFDRTATWVGDRWQWGKWVDRNGGNVVPLILDAGLRQAIADYKKR